MLTRRYRLVEQIATGGMSAIWRAFDQSLHRTVAIKVLDGCVGGDHGGRDLIRREARATARLIHPDAIEVYDYGETVTARGRLAAYVVMRLLDGRPLSERIAEGPLPWREAAIIGTRVALVLAAAHQRGIVHRDVTAENVLLTPEGAKLLDFGIAVFVGEQVDQRLAEFGTPPYVAPERLAGASVHPAVDVYGLGVLIFEMLTGAPPYPETTWEAVEDAQRTGPPPAPDGVPGLPREMAELCRSCLAQDPGQRPSAQHVAETLTAALSASATSGNETALWMRRLRLASIAAAALATWTVALLWIQPDLPPPVASVITTRTSADPTAPANGHDRRSGALAEPISGEDGTAKPDRSPSTVPSLSRSPSPAPTLRATSPPPPGAGREPTSGTRPTPTLTQAVGRFDATLEAGETAGAIRADVALDLRQVVHNLLQSMEDPRDGLKSAQRKLDDRAREGSLSPSVRDELVQGLLLIGAALGKAA
ncbi:hypothetical protein GCM10022226_67720 [Sphaerisporangium flaviroseum]|uniref:non-specific serine/threonine protein kinase n=1 Tax=Sphaerisporangium flaviroseum TaxID=509199 RepID=A0ABP7J8E4_9ACTN